MKPVKVNRVATPEEARELEALGAALIGVSLVADPRFSDHRQVGLEVAAGIAGALGHAGVVAQLGPEPDLEVLVPGLRAAGIRRIEFSAHPPPDPAVCQQLRQAGFGIGYCRIVASYDDDPSWILASIHELDRGAIDHRELEVLPDMEDAWGFLRDRTPEHEEELQIADLEHLAAAHPLFISVGATRANVGEVAVRLPSIIGLSFNLGVANPENRSAHASELGDLRELLGRARP